MKKRNKIITEDEAKNFMWVKRLAKSVNALNEVYEKVLAEVNQSNKKLDKLLFTQEIVDRLINCDEAKFTDAIPVTITTSKNNVNFGEIMGAKEFEDLCKSEFFEKSKTKTKPKTIHRR